MPQLKYEQIADHLRARIAEGEFGAGETLPSGRDLCEQFSVSRATVIKAMDILRHDGVVVAKQGSGFTVVETPVARPAGRRGGRSRITGGRPFKRLGTPAKEKPPGHIREALQLPSGSSALRRDRMVLHDDGAPYTLVTAWFAPDIADACPRLSQQGPIAEGTTHYVTRSTGRPPVQGVDAYTTRLASADEAEQLGLTLPCAVAIALHTAYDAEGRTLVCEEGVTSSANWKLTDRYPMGS